jgi:hypothetical protein
VGSGEPEHGVEHVAAVGTGRLWSARFGEDLPGVAWSEDTGALRAGWGFWQPGWALGQVESGWPRAGLTWSRAVLGRGALLTPSLLFSKYAKIFQLSN